MSSVKSRSEEMAFVVDDASLRQLDGILRSVAPKHFYELKTGDGAKVEVQTVDDLLAQPNSRARPFASVTATTPWAADARLTVTLRDGDYGNVAYDIVGDDKVVYETANRLDEWVEEVKAWYSRIATAEFVLLVLGMWLLAYVLLLVYAGAYSVITLMTVPSTELAEPAPNSRATSLWIVATYFVVFASVVLAWAAGRLRRGLFPRATFRVGGGVRRDDQVRFWRYFMGGTLLVPAVVGVLVNWLTARP